jgi:hypothetical protein
MAIKFSGEFTTRRPTEEVFDFLSNPSKFGPLLPGFQSMTVKNASHFTVKVSVGVSHIRGTAEIKMELQEADRPRRAQYKGNGSAVGSEVTITAGFDLSPALEGTKVNWQGEANIFGKLASMAGGMLEPLGRKNLQALVNGLQTALGDQVATVAPMAEGQPADTLTQQSATAGATAPAGESAGQSLPHSVLQNVQIDSGEASGEGNHSSTGDQPSQPER